jgi:hypothetical protein
VPARNSGGRSVSLLSFPRRVTAKIRDIGESGAHCDRAV